AHAERRLERRGIASRAQPAIVSRLIAGGGASMPSFGPPPVEIGMGSNAANARRPARNPPICESPARPQPLLIEPSPSSKLTPNHTSRKASTRGSCKLDGSGAPRKGLFATPPQCEWAAALECKGNGTPERFRDERRLPAVAK